MMIIRRAQTPTEAPRPHNDGSAPDPLSEQAAVVFAPELAADRVPSVRAIRTARSMLANRAPNGYTSALPQLAISTPDAWPDERRLVNPLHAGQPAVAWARLGVIVQRRGGKVAA